MRNKLIKQILISLFSAILIFQFLLLIGIIPYKYTWGGKLNSKQEMYVFVSISILLNALFLFAVLVKANYLKIKIPIIFVKILLWLMTIVFALNTIGNLFAEQSLELYIATPITLILSVLSLKLARE